MFFAFISFVSGGMLYSRQWSHTPPLVASGSSMMSTNEAVFVGVFFIVMVGMRSVPSQECAFGISPLSLNSCIFISMLFCSVAHLDVCCLTQMCITPLSAVDSVV